MLKNKKKLFMGTILVSLLSLVGCSSNNETTDEVSLSPEELPVATISIEDFGNVEVELYPNIAPNTVNNFISLANSGFYDGLTFHRVIEGFMIQGGDPNGNGTGGPGYQIKGEFSSNNFENNLNHTEGVISMARSYDKDSAGSQFFIMTGDSPHLDGEYASFGKVIDGIDIVHQIETVETDANDMPLKQVTISSIKVDTKGIDYNEPEKN